MWHWRVEASNVTETKHESEKIRYNAKHGSENDQGFGHYPLFVQCSFEASYFKFLNLWLCKFRV